MPRLFIYPEKGGSYQYSLPAARTAIGRSSSSELALADPHCSSCHAEIYPSRRGYAVKDLGSKNGTFVNGRRISGETGLKAGDTIKVGSTLIYFDRPRRKPEDSETVTHSSETVIGVQDILGRTPAVKSPQGARSSRGRTGIEQQRKLMDIIDKFNQDLIYLRPIDEFLDHIMNLIIEHIPMDRGILILKDRKNPERLVPTVTKALRDPERIENLTISQTIVRKALDNNSAILIPDMQFEEKLRQAISVVDLKIHSAMCVPLWDYQEIIGVIYADRISVAEPFKEADLTILTHLAYLAAGKIKEAWRDEDQRRIDDIKKQLATAKGFQENFLPKEDPAFEPFDISGNMRACYDVGGDYFDFIPIEQSRLAILIADVSGSGYAAALLMSHLSGALLAEIRATKDLGQLAVWLNASVHSKSEINSFISFFMGIVDREKEEIVYINAGHNPPFLLDDAGRVQSLDGTGFCLGMFPSASYEMRAVPVRPGSLFCLYTDGITEHRNKSGELFGEVRLIEILQNSSHLPAREVLNRIFNAVFTFSEGSEPEDDMTLVVLKRK